MQNLSKRLKAVASLVKKGSSVADVGTDHGYIPVYLIENDIVSLSLIHICFCKEPRGEEQAEIIAGKQAVCGDGVLESGID